MPELTVTVHELVAFCHRSGDIDHRFTPSPTGVQGIAGHQQVYRRRPASYRSEYPVEYRHSRDDMVLVLRGRADGYDPDSGLVEEIKTCRVNPAHIPPAVSRMHLAQARLYAAIIALERDVEQLEVRLTWFNLDTGRESPLSQVYTRGELEQFLSDSLAAFASWQDQLLQRRCRRDQSLLSLPFPHGSFRSGQREIAELVYKCVDRAGQLLIVEIKSSRADFLSDRKWPEYRQHCDRRSDQRHRARRDRTGHVISFWRLSHAAMNRSPGRS